MNGLKNTTVIELHISSNLGASIGECMKEAVLLAAQEWRNVTLTHNGKKYRVLCNDLLGCVLEVKPDPVEGCNSVKE